MNSAIVNHFFVVLESTIPIPMPTAKYQMPSFTIVEIMCRGLLQLLPRIAIASLCNCELAQATTRPLDAS